MVGRLAKVAGLAVGLIVEQWAFEVEAVFVPAFDLLVVGRMSGLVPRAAAQLALFEAEVGFASEPALHRGLVDYEIHPKV